MELYGWSAIMAVQYHTWLTIDEEGPPELAGDVPKGREDGGCKLDVLGRS